jgi:error-prone DNA polymerase
MVANVVRYRARSAVRDIGKVLGLPAQTLNDLVGKFSKDRALALPDNEWLRTTFIGLLREIEYVPRHLSIHSGGFLLGHEPVSDLVPIEPATMPRRTVIQWDKTDIDALGLFKVDLLGLGILNAVKRAFVLIEENYGKAYSLATVPREDRATFDMIGRAETVGTFQVESRAQQATLPRLAPINTFYDLAIAVGLIRPGPITGKMVNPYIRRRRGLEPVTYPHDSLIPVLSRTLGIPLFQEQVMSLAITTAGYTPGEADQLRRDMAAFGKNGNMKKHQETIMSRMVANGIAPEFAQQIYDQLKGFGAYGFPESHAISFAYIAYATSWVKCHYPAAYLCGLLNAQPMGFYSPATLIGDAKRDGVTVLPIDVNCSDWECTLERHAGTLAVRIGLRYVLGLHESDARRIVAAQPFESLQSLALRLNLSSAHMGRLAKAGAFESLEPNRRGALWESLGIVASALPFEPVAETTGFIPLNPFEAVTWDLSATGSSARGHPMESLRAELTRQGLPTSEQVSALANGSRVRYVGQVICRQRPGTASGVLFITLEDELGLVNLIVWPSVFDKYELLATTQSLLGVTGTLQEESGVRHIVVRQLWIPKLEALAAPAKSRNFH